MKISRETILTMVSIGIATTPPLVVVVAHYWIRHDVIEVAPRKMPYVFRPLWKDDYEILKDPQQWHFPVGVTQNQKEVIAKFDRAWIATTLHHIEPANREKQFHGEYIIAYRELTSESDRRRLRSAFEECYDERRPVHYLGEPYSDIGIRLQYGERTVDVHYGDFHRIFFVCDENDMRILFHSTASEIPSTIARLTRGVPRFDYDKWPKMIE